MKTKITIIVFLLIPLCFAVQAQKKMIEIKTSFDLDVRYVPSRMESVGFNVEYKNHTTETSQHNYKITYKPKGDTKFIGKDPILLKSPIDIEAMRQEFNQKFQIMGDEIARAISNNTIYNLAYILDTIPNPVVERTISGNLILNNYIQTYENKESEKNHKSRQSKLQMHTQELIQKSIEADKKTAEKIELDSIFRENKKQIVSIDYKKNNIESVRKRLIAEQVGIEADRLKNTADSVTLVQERERIGKILNDETKEKNALQIFKKILQSNIANINKIPTDQIIDDNLLTKISVYVSEITNKQLIPDKKPLIDLSGISVSSTFKDEKNKILAILTTAKDSTDKDVRSLVQSIDDKKNQKSKQGSENELLIAEINTETAKKNELENFGNTLLTAVRKIEKIDDHKIIDEVLIKTIHELNDVIKKNQPTPIKRQLIDFSKLKKTEPFLTQKGEILKVLEDEVDLTQKEINKVDQNISLAIDEKGFVDVKVSELNGDKSQILLKKADNLQELSKLTNEALDADKAILIRYNAKLDTSLVKYRQILKNLNDSIIKKANFLDSISIFQINKFSIQIERGFIERIQVYVPSNNSDKYNVFENIYAIGFSSIKNLKNFTSTKLYSRLTDDYIYLSDVISNYDNLLENYTRDYSPADTTINHFKPNQGFIRLNREQFANLFDARIYTDLMGLSDSKPNGLIQIELARKFNILTSRVQIGNHRIDWGALTYLNMFGSLSKIEKNKKYLPLRNENKGIAGQLTSPYYATNLDFRLYQNLSFGAELNLFLLDYPDGKVTGYLDIGSMYGQTPLTYNKRTVIGSTISQSERDSSLIAHSATIYPKLTLEIFSEKRVRLSMSYQFNITRIYSNNNFKAIASYAKSDLEERATEPYARKSHMLEVNLTASPTSSKHGRFFLRTRYFIQNRDHNTFFSQIQFGYAYNIRLKKFE